MTHRATDLLGPDLTRAPEILMLTDCTGAQLVEPCSNDELTSCTQIWESFTS